MHRTKRQARNLAWSDKNNPFAKRWAHREIDPQDQIENGNGAALFRPQTDDPSDYMQREADPRLSEWSIEHQSRQPVTMPAVSRRRPNEAGDNIGQMPFESSPPASLRQMPVQGETVSGEKAINPNNNNNANTAISSDTTLPEQPQTGKTHHGLAGWFQDKKVKKDKKKAKDDNGKVKKKFTFMSQINATLFNSWINVLLICSPIGIALYYAGVNKIAVFVVNFIAIIPLAAMLSYATEEIALRTNEVIGGLLNASFGNAVELIVSIIALTKDQILIVQTSLIGSMLSNLLLVMGMCFFGGGVNRIEQAFNMTVAQTASSLLFLAVSALLIPTVFQIYTGTGDATPASTPVLAPGELGLSRATALLLLIVYGCYLFFQLKSHAKMYQAPSEKNQTRDFSRHKQKVKGMIPNKMRRRSVETSSKRSDDSSDADEEEREEPQLAIWVAVLTLAISTVLVALNAEYLVDSINDITCGTPVSKYFVGLILLPIVGNAAEHATAVTVAIKDKMDLAIGVAVGSSMQIALLVLPLIVVLGWILGKDDMTLYFDGFQIAVLFVAVLLVNYLIQDGKSHWLEGILLLILYIIIAVAAWFHPATDDQCPAKA